MANIVLPTPGQKPWDLNAPIMAINAEVSGLTTLTTSGRLSEDGINDAIGGVVTPALAGKADAATTPTIVHAGVAGGPSVVPIGDSNFQIGTTASARQYGESAPSLAAHKSNGRFVLTENAGVASDTVQMIAARLPAEVIAKHPAACVVLAGSNSTTKGQAHYDDARAVYENQIILPLLAAGILPVLCTIPPRDGSRTFDTSGTYGVNGPLIYRLTLAWNAFVRAMAGKYRLPLVDIYAVVSDPNTGDFKTGWTGDGVHWYTRNAHDVGQAIADVLATVFPSVAVPLSKDRYSALNFYPDGLFLGTFNQGTGGRYPNGFNGTASTNLTVAAVDPVAGDPLTAGKWMKLGRIAGAASFNVNSIRTLAQIATSTGLPITAGQRVGFGFAYKIENMAADMYWTVSLSFRGAAGAVLRSWTPLNQFKIASKGVVWIEDVIPADTIDIRADFACSADGTGELSIGQLTAINLDANGIPSLKTAA